MFSAMKFVVRYWSSRLPEAYREVDGSPRWVDYSLHPASKLGLHNALLVVHDRLEILHAHGGAFDCAVFVIDSEHVEKLSPARANALFSALPRGEAKWLDIHNFLLPAQAEDISFALCSKEQNAVAQLPLFDPPLPHCHTGYDDLEATPHSLDVDV